MPSDFVVTSGTQFVVSPENLDKGKKMKILVHNTSATNFTSKLPDLVISAVSKEEVHFTSEIDAFTEALLMYRIEEPIVVIQLFKMEEITVIKTLQDLFDGLFLIMVTSSDNADLLRSCRQFYPRLLVSNEKDYDLIDVVIRKCLKKPKSQPLRY